MIHRGHSHTFFFFAFFFHMKIQICSLYAVAFVTGGARGELKCRSFLTKWTFSDNFSRGPRRRRRRSHNRPASLLSETSVHPSNTSFEPSLGREEGRQGEDPPSSSSPSVKWHGHRRSCLLLYSIKKVRSHKIGGCI